jgi:hypothetical protein
MHDALLAGIPDYQAVFFWEYVHHLDELLDYAMSCARGLDAGALYGFTSRIRALRDDLVDELPPDPRLLSPGGPPICFPLKTPRGILA